MKRAIFIRLLFLCVVAVITVAGFTEPVWNTVIATETGKMESTVERLLDLKHTLRFNEAGKFKIVIFSDIQDTYPMEADTVLYMNQILDLEKPDLVLLGGDNHNGTLNSESMLKTYLQAMSKPMESRKIPWAQIYGNHVEGGYGYKMSAPGKEKQQELFESFPYNISKAGEVYGVGNYVLPILRSDSDKVAFNVFAMDSHTYMLDARGGKTFENSVLLDRPIYGGLKDHVYETIHFDQIRWYWKSSVALEKYSGQKVAAMMLFHIPLYEYEYIVQNPTQTGMIGVNMDGISAPELNSGLLQACYERGDVKGIFVGHCHRNDFVGTYMGIKLGFVPTIGSNQYFDASNRGARVIEIDENDAFNFTTRMVYCKDLQ